MLCERCQIEIKTPEAISDIALMVKGLSLESLPSVASENYAGLPSIPGVYFAISDSGICYVGASSNMRRRWCSHPQLVRFLKETNGRILWMALLLHQIREAEKAAITQFTPLWNKGGAQYMRPNQVARLFPVIGYERVGVRQQW